MSQSRNIKLTVAGLLVLIGLVITLFLHRISLPRLMTPEEMQVNGLYLLDTPRDTGDFELVDHHGAVFDRARLRGKWSLVFFGFTNCPDGATSSVTLWPLAFSNRGASSSSDVRSAWVQKTLISTADAPAGRMAVIEGDSSKEKTREP